MLHSLSNKVFFFLILFFFLNKTIVSEGEKQKVLYRDFYHLNKYKDVEVLLDPGLHIMAAVTKTQMHTLKLCQHTRTHTLTHAPKRLQLQSDSYCTKTLTLLPSLCERQTWSLKQP